MISQSHWTMERSSRLMIVLWMLSGAVLSPVAAGEPGATALKTEPYNFSQEDVTRFLREKGMNVEDVTDISRDARGTRLFILLLHKKIDQGRMSTMITIESNGLGVVTRLGSRCYPNSEGEFVAWFGPEATKTIHFKDGESLTLSLPDMFAVDPGGKYFIVHDRAGTWLGRISSPHQRVLISKEIRGERVFAKGTKIYVCGQSYSRHVFLPPTQQAACLLLLDDGKQFQIQDRYDFDWASGIVDVDPCSERLLLWDKLDSFNSVYMCELGTKKRHRLGFAKRFQFFLADDLLRNEKTPTK